jgi:hypothetical protein
MNKQKRFCIVLFMFFLVFVCLPLFPVVVARSCTISVGDSAGKPFPGVTVYRGWAYGSRETLEQKVTDYNGGVTFDTRIEKHSLFGRLLSLVGVMFVHGDAGTSDEYLIRFSKEYTADIESNAHFKWVYDKGHIAKVDLGGLPQHEHQVVNFILRKKS